MAQTAELLLLQDTRLHTDSNGSAMPFPCDCTLPVYGNGEAPAKLVASMTLRHPNR